MNKAKLLIADDHQLFLDGIVSLLQTEEGLGVAATANNGQQVLQLLKGNKYDICILDINMPELNGLETARLIRKSNSDTKVIMLTMHNDKEFIAEMLMIGVNGYVLKNTTRTELVLAIRSVLQGKTYFSSEVHDSIANDYMDRMRKEKTRQTEVPVILTAREIDIIKLLAKENTNADIAGLLHISFRTVETHRKNIMHKTNTKNLAGLIRYAYDKGLL